MMIDFTFEITEADPQSGALFAMYQVGDRSVPFAISMAPGDEWDEETIAVRGYQAMGRVLQFIKEREAIESVTLTSDDCAHLIGKSFSDTFDPHPSVTAPRPPDYHPIKQGRRMVGIAKHPSEVQWEVYERDAEDAERQLIVFRRDYGCSPAQLRVQLLKRDALGDVDEAMRSQPREVEIEWEYSNSVLRTSAVATAIQNALKLSDEEVDDLWIAAQLADIDRRRFGP